MSILTSYLSSVRRVISTCSRPTLQTNRFHLNVLPANPNAPTSSPDCRSFSIRGLQEDCLYSLLGVSRTASDKEIKQAFLQRVKQLHPDLREAGIGPSPDGGGPGVQGPANAAEDTEDPANAEFVRVMNAKEILGCPERRALYDMKLMATEDLTGDSFHRRRGAGGGARNEGTHHSSSSTGWSGGPWGGRRGSSGDDEEWRRERMERETQSHRSPPSWIKDYAAKDPFGYEEEFQTATMHAFLGPKLDASVLSEFPSQFETEERREPVFGDLLHIVSGRTLLGVVREVPSESLQIQADQPQHNPKSEESSSQDPDEHLKKSMELIYGNMGLCLEAKCFKTVCPKDPSKLKDSIVFHHEGALLGRVIADFESQEDFLYFYDANDQVTHIGLYMVTPMVSSMYWYDAITRKCQWRCRRAWMPPSNLWLFPPRCETHDIGGWYFERWDSLQPSTGIPFSSNTPAGECLFAGVPVMVAARMVLGREHQHLQDSTADASSDDSKRVNKSWWQF